METPEIDELKIAPSDRWLIAAALDLLRDEVRETLPQSPLFRRISELRDALSVGAIRKEAPVHVVIDDLEFLNLMAALPSADTWLLRWEKQTDYGNYKLIAEIEAGGRVSQFEIAANLLGTGSFQHLRNAEAVFVTAVEARVQTEAPKGSIQLQREIMEIPTPWDVVANENDVQSDIEGYLADITEDSRILDYRVRATLVDIHSNSDLASAEFAGVWAEIFASEEYLETLRPTINGYSRDLIENPTRVLA